MILSRLAQIDWVIFGRQKNRNHVHMGQESLSSHVGEFIFGEGDGGRHLGDKLQGSGLVVELTRVRSIMGIFRSVVGLSQVCLSGIFPKVK